VLQIFKLHSYEGLETAFYLQITCSACPEDCLGMTQQLPVLLLMLLLL
jgi:hypothetical protein